MTIQDQILKLLAAMREDFGVSVVFVTHDLAVVAETCERIAVMYAGQVVETGTVDEVFRAPRHPYTLGLLRSVPRFDLVRQQLLDSIPGQPPDLVVPPERLPLPPPLPVRAATTACRATSRCARSEWPARPPASTTTSASRMRAATR